MKAHGGQNAARQWVGHARLAAIGCALFFAFCHLPANAQQVDPGAPLPAFPGAEGFAAYVTGGRGGEVYHVTHLGESGPGSLRDAVSRGPRIVVFDVSGYIVLRSPLSVRSNITIAGQTAPGDGIATKNYEVSFSGSHNVIVRHIRFRQGLTSGQDRKSAVAIYQGSNMILDHVSIEWGRWDTVDMNASSNITIQNSIIGEGIAPQRFGCLCQSDNITFSHDLLINNHSRNPKAKGMIEFDNNVVYNWELDAFIEGGFSAAESYANVIGNYFIKGPSTGSHGPFAGGNTNFHIYAAGNFYDEDRSAPLGGRPTTVEDLGDVDVRDAPFDFPREQSTPPRMPTTRSWRPSVLHFIATRWTRA